MERYHRTLEDLPLRSRERFGHGQKYMVHEQLQSKAQAGDITTFSGFGEREADIIISQPTLSSSKEQPPVTVEQCRKYLASRGLLTKSAGCCGGKKEGDKAELLQKTIIRATQVLEHYGGLAELKDLVHASHMDSDPAVVNFHLPCESVTIEIEEDEAKKSEEPKSFFSFLEAQKKISLNDCHVSFRRDTIGIVQQNREIFPDANERGKDSGKPGAVNAADVCPCCAPCFGCCCAQQNSAQAKFDQGQIRRLQMALAGPAAAASEATRVFNLPRHSLTSVNLSTYADAVGLTDGSRSACCGGCCTCCCPIKNTLSTIDWSSITAAYSKSPLELQHFDMPSRVISLGLTNVVLPEHARPCDAVMRLQVSPVVHVDAILQIVKLLQTDVSLSRDLLFHEKYGEELAKAAIDRRRKTVWNMQDEHDTL